MFHTIIKNYQSKLSGSTWQKTLRNKEVAKNNYQVNGDIKKAKAFVSMASHYTFEPVSPEPLEHIIFSYDKLTVALNPAYSYTRY